MTQYRSWILTDVAHDVWVDDFSINSLNVHLPTPHGWSIHKRTLRGGRRDGVDLIEVRNGDLAFAVLPTRGMGLWRGDYRGNFLGWHAPLHGPVHPKYVEQAGNDGLGWLAGFDEWLCRCGLASNGPPGEDAWTDKAGQAHRQPLTLHGRIANTPAHYVEVRVSLEQPYELSVTGHVEEASLFGGRLALTTTYTTSPGSNRLVIHDVVENKAAQPAEMQLLYHCNVGPPFLEAGSRVLIPVAEMAPLTPRAAEGIDTWETYAAPQAGYAEQNYAFDPLGDRAGHTLAMLRNKAGDRGLVLRWNKKELPCFTVWKNTIALQDGYVTGLEPATNYPNFRSFERQQGRVPVLPPGGHFGCTWSIEVQDAKAGVDRVMAEIATLQASHKATVHRTPQAKYSAL